MFLSIENLGQTDKYHLQRQLEKLVFILFSFNCPIAQKIQERNVSKKYNSSIKTNLTWILGGHTIYKIIYNLQPHCYACTANFLPNNNYKGSLWIIWNHQKDQWACNPAWDLHSLKGSQSLTIGLFFYLPKSCFRILISI